MQKQYEMVKEFHKAFGHPIADNPWPLETDRKIKRATWMAEEVQEFIEADTLVDQIDALCDLIYFALGSAVEMGIELTPLFALVHKANMDKLDKDGRPIYGLDTKVMKPEGWIPPQERIETFLKLVYKWPDIKEEDK
jgi:predicted HAD superfamily Cof-like phosphohydrolase